MSILMVMFDLALGWGLLLAGQILASRAVRSDEAASNTMPYGA